ncbi:MAG: threonylcarbamoyl-AMP synthase [Crocinitomicaceae bacterium]|nr:threonylcarbamoyl-AMP synthase [Crocinitomicaceae bacterium]|tara:strand:+ start:214 stop:828 length:615 start_codon:yes stop_codon:yes gene_type:complete
MLIEILGENPDSRKIKQVADVLKNGGIVVIPTDTIYAFAASLNNKKGLERLAKFKGVKLNKAQFSLICDGLSDISTFTKPIERNVFRALKNSLPGPFTFILNANNHVAKLFGTNKKEVGIRVPDHQITKAIVQQLGHPLVSTSVHDDDHIIEYTTDPQAIFEKYEDNVEMVIDAGYGKNQASTIVDCTTGELSILRQGIGELNA